MGQQLPIFEIDYIDGGAQKTPSCRKCKIPYRPNVQYKNDLEFLEGPVNSQLDQFSAFLDVNKRRSFSIIEIGTSPVQPLARELAMSKYLNDKYSCTLIRINPIKERTKQYEWENEQFQKIESASRRRGDRERLVQRLTEDIALLEARVDKHEYTKATELNSKYDGMLNRSDAGAVEGAPQGMGSRPLDYIDMKNLDIKKR